MLDLEVLILKLFAIDGLATGAVPRGKISTLDHKPSRAPEIRHSILSLKTFKVTVPFDDPVESAALVVQRFAGVAVTLLARASRA